MDEDRPTTALDISISARVAEIHHLEHLNEAAIGKLREELADLIMQRWGLRHIEISIAVKRR
jgi:hypothetical protein